MDAASANASCNLKKKKKEERKKRKVKEDRNKEINKDHLLENVDSKSTNNWGDSLSKESEIEPYWTI